MMVDISTVVYIKRNIREDEENTYCHGISLGSLFGFPAIPPSVSQSENKRKWMAYDDEDARALARSSGW